MNDTAVTFNLWHLRASGPSQLAFDVTRANAPGLARGDKRWMTNALRSLGTNLTPASWTITPSRATYFSDYRGPDEAWVDRWAEVWVVTVRFDGYFKEVPITLRPTPLSALDSTYTSHASERHDEHATIVGVGPDRAIPPGVAQLGEPPILWPVDDARRLLRVELNVSFPRDLGRLEDAVDALERDGWAIEWRAATMGRP